MPAVSWIDALRLYNVGMNSWAIPKKGSSQFDAVEKMRKGDRNVTIPQDKPARLAVVNPAKFKLDVEEVRAALQSWFAQRKPMKTYPKGSATFGDSFTDVQRAESRLTKLPVTFPALPSRDAGGKTFGRWWVSGKSDGNEVIFDIDDDTVRRVAFEGDPAGFVRRTEEALNGPLTFRVHRV